MAKACERLTIPVTSPGPVVDELTPMSRIMSVANDKAPLSLVDGLSLLKVRAPFTDRLLAPITPIGLLIVKFVKVVLDEPPIVWADAPSKITVPGIDRPVLLFVKSPPIFSVDGQLIVPEDPLFMIRFVYQVVAKFVFGMV